MDETGLGLGVCTNTRVFARSGSKHALVKSPQNREWVSILEIVSIMGKSIWLLVIFQGRNLQSSWFHHDEVPD